MKLKWRDSMYPFRNKGGDMAYSGNVMIGFICQPRVDNPDGRWVYQIDGIHMRGYVGKTRGEVKDRATAMLAIRRAWNSWCKEAGLVNG